ncbi:hypothetical protein LCGC14_0311070 [marine sediment metagenome]|uniref:Transglycosylase SLT domain-containing protein n=1 Tax=marine sediment metagenome TaxID=412755 RepID=A0A0F9TSK2_9ZZZZ
MGQVAEEAVSNYGIHSSRQPSATQIQRDIQALGFARGVGGGSTEGIGEAEYQVRYSIALLWPEREWARAVCISYWETGESFDPLRVGAAGERGVFQVHPVHINRFISYGGWGSAFIVSVNASVAYEIWLDDGGSFKQWTTASLC